MQEHYYSPEQVARREQATAAQAATQQRARQSQGKAARQRASARRQEVNHVRMLGDRLAQARQLIPMAEAALQQLLSQVSDALTSAPRFFHAHAACAMIRACPSSCVSWGLGPHQGPAPCEAGLGSSVLHQVAAAPMHVGLAA